MTNVDDDRIVPGCKVLVSDSRLYKNDIDTPVSVCMMPATVVCRYGYKYKSLDSVGGNYWYYNDCVDVKFDHRQEISKGHFTSYIEVLEKDREEILN